MKQQINLAKSAVAALTIGFALAFSIAAHADNAIRPFTASKAIDLTHALHNDMVFWPGGVPFKKDRLTDYDPDGYRLHKFTMGENSGTHIDAPSHFIKGGESIDQLALDQLIVPLAVIDARAASAKHDDYLLTSADMKKWEAQHGKVPANSLFVMNSGWHKHFDTPQKYINMDDDKVMHFPGFSVEAAELLVERDVAGIGIDTLSLDHGASQDFAVHVVMLKAGKYQVENMAALDLLPATGATAVVGVLPVRDGSQAQARIFALLP